MNTTELIGYLASALVVGSFLIPNNIRLTRIVNLFGALFFVVYGWLIQSYPVIIPNVFLIFIQMYYLLIVREGGKKSTAGKE